MEASGQTTGSTADGLKRTAAASHALWPKAAQALSSAPAPARRVGDVQVQDIRKIEVCAQAAAAQPPQAQDAPDLPDPSGASAAPKVVLQRVKNVRLTQDSTLFAVLQTMTEARQSDMKMANLIKRMRAQMQMEAKDRELCAKREEIRANKISAATQFAGGFAAISLSALAAFKLHFQDQAVNQFVSGLVNVYDQTFGGRAEANEAGVVQKLEMNVGQQEQMRVDAASAWFEQVKDARKSAQQAIMTHIQMVGDAVNNVWR